MIETRKLWGIVLVTPRNHTGPLSTGWLPPKPPLYAFEPTRSLTFTTRAAARGMCALFHARHAKNPVLRKWRFRVVRVIETVRTVK